jgi:hypothetical protein
MAGDHLWSKLQTLVRQGADAGQRLEASTADVARAIAVCEYELRQLERDIGATRRLDEDALEPPGDGRPFAIEARLRDPARRRESAWWQALGLVL